MPIDELLLLRPQRFLTRRSVQTLRCRILRLIHGAKRRRNVRTGRCRTRQALCSPHWAGEIAGILAPSEKKALGYKGRSLEFISTFQLGL